MLVSPRATALAASSILVFAACAAGPTVFRHPTSDVAEIRTVAVMPFDNLADADRRTADRIHQLLLGELQANEEYEVIEPGLVAQAVRERSGTLSALPPEDLKEIGAALGADGLLMGAVLSFTDSRGADGGEATIQLRLVESRTGATVWTASQSRKGSSFAKRFFGLASDTGAEVARKVIRSELATLSR